VREEEGTSGGAASDWVGHITVDRLVVLTAVKVDDQLAEGGEYAVFFVLLRGVDGVDEGLTEMFWDVVVELVEHITEGVHCGDVSDENLSERWMTLILFMSKNQFYGVFL